MVQVGRTCAWKQVEEYTIRGLLDTLANIPYDICYEKGGGGGNKADIGVLVVR